MYACMCVHTLTRLMFDVPAAILYAMVCISFHQHIWTDWLGCLAHCIVSGLEHTSKGRPEAAIGGKVLLC